MTESTLQDVAVDPDRLLLVAWEENGAPIEIVALSCHYVAAGPDAKRSIGIEVIFDPEIQPPRPLPTEAYRCPTARLEQRLLPPKDVKKIAPIKVPNLAP